MTSSSPRRTIVKPGDAFLKEQCPVARTTFQVGDQVVICSRCSTPYQADSWSFIGERCVVCAGPQSAYAPPPPLAQRPEPPPLQASLEPTRVLPAPGVPPGMGLAWLVGPGGRLYAVKQGDTNIGRDSDNDIVIDDGTVSAHHARIRHAGGNAYYLYDLVSTNGTRLDGRPITRALLYDGDQVDFGRVRLTYRQVNFRDVPAS